MGKSNGYVGSISLDRRGFVLGAAASGAALALASCSPSSQTSNAAEAATAEETAVTVEADETVECDFVVVGGGMAGFSAAIQAAQDGCRNVVLLEKNSVVGGSTLHAEGIFGNGDSYQAECGYEAYDLSEILAEEVDWSHGVINSSMFMQYMQSSPEYIEWLRDLGVEFSSLLDAGTGRFLLHIYEGGNGTSAIEAMSDAAAELGVDVRTSTAATALLMEGDAVVGVQAEASSSVIDFKAPTVCIATGGIGTNAEMMDIHTKLDAGKWTYIGSEGQDGDGITLVEATAHGRGKTVSAENMWLMVEGAEVQSDVNYAAGMEGSNIWVNEKAKRFCDESIAQSFYVCNNTVHNQGVAYSIFDQNHVAFFEQNGTTCMWSGFCPFGQPMPDVQDALDEGAENDAVKLYKADTLAELAELIGLDADALQETVDAWNADVAAGADSQFGKAASFMAAIEEGPFYAGKLINGVLATVGGVRINEDAQVTAPDGTPVEGLYAAGVVATGFAGEVYGMAACGSNQGPACYLGRLSGKAAAERA